MAFKPWMFFRTMVKLQGQIGEMPRASAAGSSSAHAPKPLTGSGGR